MPPTIQRSRAITRGVPGVAFGSSPSDRAAGEARGGEPPQRSAPSVLLEVDAFSQFLAGLEVRDVLLGHLHPLAGFGIASSARRPVVEPEADEPPDLDPLALGEAFRHGIEDHLHREFGVFGYQLRELRRQAVDQLRFGHHGLAYP